MYKKHLWKTKHSENSKLFINWSKNLRHQKRPSGFLNLSYSSQPALHSLVSMHTCMKVQLEGGGARRAVEYLSLLLHAGLAFVSSSSVRLTSVTYLQPSGNTQGRTARWRKQSIFDAAEDLGSNFPILFHSRDKEQPSSAAVSKGPRKRRWCKTFYYRLPPSRPECCGSLRSEGLLGHQFRDSEILPKTVLDYSGICSRELAEILIRSELTELSISVLSWILILLPGFVDLCCISHVLQVNYAAHANTAGYRDWIIQLSLLCRDTIRKTRFHRPMVSDACTQDWHSVAQPARFMWVRAFGPSQHPLPTEPLNTLTSQLGLWLVTRWLSWLESIPETIGESLCQWFCECESKPTTRSL